MSGYMLGFGRENEYPEHVSVLEMSLGVSLLGMNEMREFGGIPDKEDGCVVEDPIPVSLLGLELDSKTSWVASGISRSGFATDG